jgi:ArsR family transcriptional regulator
MRGNSKAHVVRNVKAVVRHDPSGPPTAGSAHENRDAVEALAALAQNTRLAIFRLLVQQGPEGVAVGEIAERLQLAGATLSFHLKELAHARLVAARQAGRFIYYSANYRTMNGLIEYLTRNCCQGATCDIACAPAAQRKRRTP